MSKPHGKGAQSGNTNAQKSDRGCTISLYLTADDMRLLRLVRRHRGEDDSDASCIKLAKMAAKMGINLLIMPKDYEEAVQLVKTMHPTR